jgi:hypothetical protein
MNIKMVAKTVCGAGMLALALAACAQPGPVLLRDIVYQAPTGSVRQPLKGIAGISPLKDLRGTTNSLLGKRTIEGALQNDLVVQGTVTDVVTAALRDALVARGITVKDEPAWDLEAGPGKRSGVDLLFGGEIKAFWIDAVSRPLNVRTKATVQLRVAAADAVDGKVFRTLNLNSALERDDIVFSFDTVQGTLAEALSAALNQLLDDNEVKRRLQK